MKKFIKGLLGFAIVGTVFASGYAVNEVTREYDKAVQAETISTPVQNMAKDEGFNIATIPSDKDNIFTQYFTITRVMDNVVEAKNTFYENDFVFIEKTDFDKIEPKEGLKIAVTYNHDTVVTVTLAEQEKPVAPVEQPQETPKEQPKQETEKPVTPPVQKVSNVVKPVQETPVKKEVKQETKQAPKVNKQDKPKNDNKQVSQEKPKVNNNLQANKPNNKTVKPEQKEEKKQDNSFIEKDSKRANSTKEYVITEETQNKLINAQNENEKYLLENNGYKKGDKIKVTFGNSGYHDDIVKQEKVGNDDKDYQDAFEENARTDINRNNPNYVQTEDGSFVPKDFWDKK